MIRVKKGTLTKKEKHNVSILIGEILDPYTDFYITKNNLRLAIKENKDILFNCLVKGDSLAFDEDRGVAFVTGFSDKAKRKYVKLLAKDSLSADQLLKVLLWHMDCDLYAKIKKDSPLKTVLQKNNFRFVGDRGKELLLMRRYIINTKHPKKEETTKGDNDVN